MYLFRVTPIQVICTTINQEPRPSGVHTMCKGVHMLLGVHTMCKGVHMLLGVHTVPPGVHTVEILHMEAMYPQPPTNLKQCLNP